MVGVYAKCCDGFTFYQEEVGRKDKSNEAYFDSLGFGARKRERALTKIMSVCTEKDLLESMLSIVERLPLRDKHFVRLGVYSSGASGLESIAVNLDWKNRVHLEKNDIGVLGMLSGEREILRTIVNKYFSRRKRADRVIEGTGFIGGVRRLLSFNATGEVVGKKVDLERFEIYANVRKPNVFGNNDVRIKLDQMNVVEICTPFANRGHYGFREKLSYLKGLVGGVLLDFSEVPFEEVLDREDAARTKESFEAFFPEKAEKGKI